MDDPSSSLPPAMPPRLIRAGYDGVASRYAERFAGELAHKPFDRTVLTEFAAGVGGVLLDIGCGPGHTSGFMAAAGAEVVGLDLSPALVREARSRFPGVRFLAADMLSLPFADGSLAGAALCYSIVHFDAVGLAHALAEAARVLVSGGGLLVSFHVEPFDPGLAGLRALVVERFLDGEATLDFRFHASADVAEAAAATGFAGITVAERVPYPDVEYASRRAYLRAVRR